jgi:hypothetical protein
MEESSQLHLPAALPPVPIGLGPIAGLEVVAKTAGHYTRGTFLMTVSYFDVRVYVYMFP